MNAAENFVADHRPLPTSREERGRQIAKMGGIKEVGSRYAVPSQSGAASAYLVDLVEETCTCADYELRRQQCKHVHAVYTWIAWGCEVAADGTTTETLTVKRKTFKRDWSAYNEAQTSEGIYVERLLRALCDGIEEPTRKPGPGRKPLPLKDAAFASVSKVYGDQVAATGAVRPCRQRREGPPRPRRALQHDLQLPRRGVFDGAARVPD